MLGKKIVAFALSAVLAASLCPGLALAETSTFAAGQADEVSALSTQSTKTVYVIDEVDEAYKGTYTDADGNEQTQTFKRKYGLTYRNGLLASLKTGSNSDITLAYDGINLKKITAQGNTYSFDSSKGKVRSGTRMMGDSKVTYKFGYNKSGKLTSRKSASYSKVDGKLSKISSNTMKYKLNKGCPVEITVNSIDQSGEKHQGTFQKFTYDKNGNIATAENQGEGSAGTMTNTYDGKRLTKRVSESIWGTYTYTYHYKKVVVNASAASTIAAQQWALLNRNLNGAFGCVMPCPLYW